MRISVTLFATLEGRLPDGRGDIELPDGARVAELLHALGVEDDEAGVVTINRKAASRDATLAQGDSVLVVPLVSGG